jgi:hypothetical protein
VSSKADGKWQWKPEVSPVSSIIKIASDINPRLFGKTNQKKAAGSVKQSMGRSKFKGDYITPRTASPNSLKCSYHPKLEES